MKGKQKILKPSIEQTDWTGENMLLNVKRHIGAQSARNWVKPCFLPPVEFTLFFFFSNMAFVCVQAFGSKIVKTFFYAYGLFELGNATEAAVHNKGFSSNMLNVVESNLDNERKKEKQLQQSYTPPL